MRAVHDKAGSGSNQPEVQQVFPFLSFLWFFVYISLFLSVCCSFFLSFFVFCSVFLAVSCSFHLSLLLSFFLSVFPSLAIAAAVDSSVHSSGVVAGSPVCCCTHLLLRAVVQ